MIVQSVMIGVALWTAMPPPLPKLAVIVLYEMTQPSMTGEHRVRMKTPAPDGALLWWIEQSMHPGAAVLLDGQAAALLGHVVVDLDARQHRAGLLMQMTPPSVQAVTRTSVTVTLFVTLRSRMPAP